MKVYVYVLLSAVNLNSSAIKSSALGNKMYDDIRFWAGQMVEHAEFASDFTEDAQLQEHGLKLAQAFKKFNRSQLNENDQKEFLDLTKKILQYQKDVRAALKKSKENKDLEKALLDHMDKETVYAQKKAKGKKLSKREEVQFWSEEHEGEAHVMAALMDPKAPILKEKAEKLEKELKSNAHAWKDSLQVIEQANMELDALGQALEKDPSKTEISPKLANHEKRERARAAETFQELEFRK